MANELNKIINRASRQINATDAQIEAFVLRLEKFLDHNLEEIVGKVEIGETSGKEAAKILGALFTELQKAGLNEEIGRLRAIYAEELRFVRDELIEQDFEKPFTDADSAGVNALVNNSLDQVATRVTQYGLDIQSTVMQSVLTGQEVDYKAIKEQYGNAVASNIKTEVGTAVSAFNATINATKAEELGLDLFLYVGPVDKITRPFCKHLLENRQPPIYTKDEISQMDNDQNLDVLIYRGGYNCRHHWRAISEGFAKELGYKG